MIRVAAIAVLALACTADQGSFKLTYEDWHQRMSDPRNPHIRRRAAEEAQRLALGQVRETLWNVLKYDNDDETVGRAAVSLGKMVHAPMKQDVDALLHAFDRVSEFYARGRAALALGTFAPKLEPKVAARVVAVFVHWLTDRGGNAERFVAEALGMFGPRAKKAVPALEALRKHKWEQTRSAATTALAKIRGARP